MPFTDAHHCLPLTHHRNSLVPSAHIQVGPRGTQKALALSMSFFQLISQRPEPFACLLSLTLKSDRAVTWVVLGNPSGL